MRNLLEMVEETRAYLRNYVRDQELSTHLTRDIGFAETELPVDNAAVLTRGRVEVDSELIWIDRTDKAANLGIIPPYGRGMDGTQKEVHASGTRVVVQPLYPRKTVRDQLNQAITQMGKDLYGTEVLSIPVKTTNFLYELPAETRDVLSVKIADRVRRPGDEVLWLREWRFDRHAPSTVASTGKGLYVYDHACIPTDVMTVVISRDPAQLLFETQMFTDSYLPATAWDVAVLMAASRLVAMANAQNIVGRSVEANTLDSKVEPATPLSASKYLYGLASARLAEERKRLLDSSAPRIHYSRR